jgi:hypothetical protein
MQTSSLPWPTNNDLPGFLLGEARRLRAGVLNAFAAGLAGQVRGLQPGWPGEAGVSFGGLCGAVTGGIFGGGTTCRDLQTPPVAG